MTTSQHGFELVRDEQISEISSKVRLYRHIKTGAELISVENEDENKSFGVAFRTPPPDNTGLPHIMEHSVLCGSRKYPVKEPFAELLRGSMSTFLNAMTFPDKTVYPVASQNMQDFYNLVDVYMDAVFFPRLTPEILMQEGWHYELEEVEEEVIYKGVVFNEMKGNYSSPDMTLFLERSMNLLPDTPYSRNYAGDPTAIPELTWEQFEEFHKTYYHPSNARLWFYGDDDPAERLKLAASFLDEFDARPVDTSLPTQPRFDAPRRNVVPYDAGEDADSKKAYVITSWLLDEAQDMERRFTLSMLAGVLMGTSASPLRKALLESGLGEDTLGGSVDTSLREANFSVGLRGVDPDKIEETEAFLLEALAQIAKDGIDPKTIEAAVNTVEFQLREYNTGGFPRGLAMMFSALGTWIHDGDPSAPLAFEAPLSALKARIEVEDRLFERMIEAELLNNNHRSTVVLMPDASVGKNRAHAERERLDEARKAMSMTDIQSIIEETKALKEKQNTPDTPENLATIPLLTRDDLEPEIRTDPETQTEVGGVETLVHDQPTNGIVYVDVGFNLKTVPQDYLPYLSLFARSLVEMGTDKEDFVQLKQRIGIKTGGISPSRLSAEIHDTNESTYWLLLRGKALTDRVDDLLDLLHDIALTTDFSDKERFRQLALRSKAQREAGLIPGGHQVVLGRLEAHFSEVGWYDDLTGGLGQLFFLRDLVERIDSDWENIQAILEDIRQHLMQRGAMTINITLEQSDWDSVSDKLAGFVGSVPAGEGKLSTWVPGILNGDEGLSLPAQVNYVGMGANLFDLGYELHGSAHVITRTLSRGYLWNRVRVQGGAYGGFCMFSQVDGLFRFASYRDPNLLETVDIYKGAGEFLKTLEMDERELTQAIIGAVGDMDGYKLPDAKGYSAFVRHLTGYNDEKRQRIRSEVMSTTLDHYHQFGEVMAQIADNARVVVLGSPDALAEANRALPLKTTKVM